MSNAIVVLDYFLKKYKINNNRISDFDYSNFSFLSAREPVYNMKGQKVSKSFYAENGKETIRQVYTKIYGKHTFKDVEYDGVFLGMQKSIQSIDWAGEVVTDRTKEQKPYYFTLQPVFVGDGTETVTGFSSQKMRKVLKTERYNADDYLQAQNPSLYALLYNNYLQYESYLRTGDKTALVTAINNEQNAGINAVFNNTVYGTEITVKQLILDNLQ